MTKRGSNTRSCSVAAAIIFAAMAALSLAGCKNPIASSVANLQAEAVSPVLSVSQGGESSLDNGGNISFGAVSTLGYGDLSLTIRNKGKKDLEIDIAGITLNPGSSTPAGVFALSAEPAAKVSPSGSTTLTVRFAPGTEGSKSATLTIPTNDIQMPSFKCTLTGTGWAVTLSTYDATSISYTTATSGGNITSAGSGTIIERGICWSTSPNPTVSDGKCADAGTTTGSFPSCSLAGLLPGTFYYVWLTPPRATAPSMRPPPASPPPRRPRRRRPRSPPSTRPAPQPAARPPPTSA